MTTRTLTATLAAVAILGGGCGPEDPYSKDKPAQDRQTRVDSATTRTAPPNLGQPAPADPGATPPADGELPGTVSKELRDPTPTRFPGAATSPKGTLRIAAGLYGNWTSASAPKAFRRIAAISVGDARAQLRQIAAQSDIDGQQRGVRSRSAVVSIKLAPGVRGRRATVVTRDTVTGPGLPNAGPQYQVTRAQLVERGGRWVIARWEPQP